MVGQVRDAAGAGRQPLRPELATRAPRSAPTRSSRSRRASRSPRTLNPDFGQVEADPAVVNLSAFETYFAERRPFFVEGSGIFRFDIDCNDGAVPRAVLLAAHRPDAARDADRPRRRLLVDPAADDDPRRREADRARGQVLGRRADRGDAARSTPRMSDGANTSRTWSSRSPATRSGAPRASSPTSRRSGFMATATNRRLTADVSFLPERRLHRRRGLGLAPGEEGRVLADRLLGRQHRARQRGGHRGPPDEQRPRLPAPGRRPRRPRPDAHVAERHDAQARSRARSRAIACGSTATAGSRRPGSTSTTSGSCSARTSRASPTGCRSGTTSRRSTSANTRPQLQPVGRLELRRRPPRPRRQRERQRADRGQPLRSASASTSKARRSTTG